MFIELSHMSCGHVFCGLYNTAFIKNVTIRDEELKLKSGKIIECPADVEFSDGKTIETLQDYNTLVDILQARGDEILNDQ